MRLTLIVFILDLDGFLLFETEWERILESEFF